MNKKENMKNGVSLKHKDRQKILRKTWNLNLLSKKHRSGMKRGTVVLNVNFVE